MLDFEGLQDSEFVWNFYDGGDGSMGSTGGTDYGVEFGRPEFGGARAAIDTDAGGAGRFENEPSPNTVVQFFHFNPYMYVDAGFETALSFWYSTTASGFIRIYDASNNVLAQMNMAPTSGTCSAPTDPDNLNVCWSTFAVPFSGIATRVEFGGLNILYDDITLGSTAPALSPRSRSPQPCCCSARHSPVWRWRGGSESDRVAAADGANDHWPGDVLRSASCGWPARPPRPPCGPVASGRDSGCACGLSRG